MKSVSAHPTDPAPAPGLLRSRDFSARGLSPSRVRDLTRQGRLIRLSRGLYAFPDRVVSEHAALSEISIRHPAAVVCLLSALQFHGLTTQMPFEVWIAIANKARAPRIAYPPLRIVRFGGAALSAGLERHVIDGVAVQVTSVAKTVCDCFKYRNKIGLDVALEALREAWNGKRATADDLWRYAGICRVSNVMRPYLEALS